MDPRPRSLLSLLTAILGACSPAGQPPTEPDRAAADSERSAEAFRPMLRAIERQRRAEPNLMGPELGAPVADPRDARLAAAFRTVHAANPSVVEWDGLIYDVRPGGLERIDGGEVLLTLATQRDAGHASEGALGIHYLERRDGGLRIAGSWPMWTGGSQLGQATLGWTVRRDLGLHPMLVSRGNWSGQGLNCEYARLDELTPDRPVRRGTIHYLGYSNEGAIEDPARRIRVKGHVVAVRRGDSFEVRYSGTHRFTERYRRRGPEYERVGESFFAGKC